MIKQHLLSPAPGSEGQRPRPVLTTGEDALPAGAASQGPGLPRGRRTRWGPRGSSALHVLTPGCPAPRRAPRPVTKASRRPAVLGGRTMRSGSSRPRWTQPPRLPAACRRPHSVFICQEPPGVSQGSDPAHNILHVS